MRMLLASLSIFLSGVAGGQQVNCPNGSPADGVHWAGNSRHCVIVRRIEPQVAADASVLAVYLYGDGGGTTEMAPDRGVISDGQ